MRAFKRHFYRDVIFYSICILSLGIIYLLSYWSNLLYCRLRFSQCQHKDGDYFLINGEIVKKFLVSIDNMHIPAFKHQLQRYVLENEEFAVQKFHFTHYAPFKTIQEIHNSINRYGHNITLIPQKPLAIIIIREIISPLFIIQILSIGLWIYEGYVSYSCILFVISLYSIIETAVAYNSNRRLMSDLRQPESVASVIRLGEEIDIRSVDIVPGDTIIIKGNFIIPCDAIIIQGNCVVDEKNLTGESEPVYKNIKSMLYSSSLCIKSQECVAFVIATGFQTEKGKLIREILYTPEISIDFYKDSLSYLIWLSIAAILGYIIALPFKLKFQEKHPEVPQNDLIIDVLDLLTVCVPPTLPTSLQIGLSIVLNRLQSKGIYCTNVQKINTAGCTQIVCFDSAITQQNFILNGFCESHNTDIIQIEEVSDILLTCSIVCNTMIAEDIGQKAETILFQEAKASLIANIVTLKGKVYQIIKTQPTENMVVVVAEYEGLNYVYAKADPEKVYHKWNIPQNHVRLIKQYLSNGFYVVACAYKQYQEPLQSNLHYLGLIIYANKPRDHTIQIIDQLNRSQIKTIIISSENIRSASSIAKVCGVSKQLTMGILTKNEFDKQEVKWTEFEQDNEEILKGSIILEQKSIILNDEELDPINSNQDLSITGELFEYFVKYSVQNDNYQQLERILNLTKVYGGFKPQQKQILIQYMKRLQKQIAFCGDGGADILAFKTADIGISFAVNKYSVSAPFTSTQQNISCVPYILRQGRSALTISFYSFKYQTITSLIQFISCTLLYFQYAYMTNSQFLILDLFVTLPLSILMSYTDAAEELHKDIPPKSLKSRQVLLSVIGQTIIQLIFQGIVYFAQINQDWYVDSVILSNGEYTNEGYLQSFETTSLFLVSNFQYLATSIALQINNKFNQSVLNNTPYCLYCVLILIFNLYLILFARQEDTMDDYFNLTFKVTQKDKHYEMPTSWIYVFYIF
ncbi:hypothetical protein pb186bvf_006009 [Paramecium bursaria]